MIRIAVQLFDGLSRYRVTVTMIFLFYAALRVSRGGLSLNELVLLVCYGSLHWSAYLFNRYTDLCEDKISQPKEALSGSNSEQRARILALFCALMPIPVLTYFGLKPWLYILLLPVVPFYGARIPKTQIRIKSLLLVKNIYSVIFCWVAPLLAIEYVSGNLKTTAFYVVGIGYYAAVVLVYEVLWDIRDINGDRSVGTKTIANTYGITVARCFALMICLSLSLPALINKGPWYSLTQILLLIFILLANEKRSPYFYTLMPFFQASVLIIGTLLAQIK